MPRFMLMIVLLSIFGCHDLGQPSSDDMVNFKGTVVDKGANFFVINTDVQFQNQITFYPENLGDLVQTRWLEGAF